MRLPEQLWVLSKAVGRALSEAKRTIALAESCTGGGLAYCLTAVPGSSAWLQGGVVSYSNASKQALLGVSTSLLEVHGAVSEQVARAMALGALNGLMSDIAASITGIAGPTGAVPGKPVGTVCFGIARGPVFVKNGGDTSRIAKYPAEPVVHTETVQFFGDRAQIREQAMVYALQAILYSITKNNCI
jgi:nicotinamide-nucleotide amidase